MRGEAEVLSGRLAGVCPHGLAALAAVLLVSGLLTGIRWEVRSRLPGQMASFAARPSPVKMSGNILQSEAFRLPGMLPIYGSSELDRPAANRPDEFFRDRPTGFSVFPIGRGGTTCLMILQKIAAVGRRAHGRKAVIFLSPTWFAKEGVAENAVVANLTPPQLSAWLFSSTLSQPLRQRIVQRLLDYPEGMRGEMLLTAALHCLAEPTFANRLGFTLLQPFGWLQNAFFRRLEYCAILQEMRLHSDRSALANGDGTTTAPKAGGAPDWAQLAAKAEADDRARDDGAVYSASNALLPERRRAQHIREQPAGSRDEDFASKVVDSREFGDLQLLVAVLKELGVRALFISQPFNGIYRDLGGTTRRSRQIYYDKLATLLARARYPLLDFSDHEEDRFFFNDAGHPSAKAWIFYDQGMDRFYHGNHH